MRHPHAPARPVYFAIGLLITALIVMRCGNDATSSGLGTVRVRVADAPFPHKFVRSVNLTISATEIRSAGALRFQTISATPKTFDLLTLQEGKTDTAGITLLPTGSYDRMRVRFSGLEITLTDGRVLTPALPDPPEAEVAIVPPIRIVRDQASEVILDFDLLRSLSALGDASSAGGISGFVYTPVVRAVDLATVGRITGVVKHDNRTPSVLTDDVPIRGLRLSIVPVGAADTLSVLTDESGAYTAFFLPAGAYAVTASPTDSTGAWSISDVVVTTANPTRQDALTDRR